MNRAVLPILLLALIFFAAPVYARDLEFDREFDREFPATGSAPVHFHPADDAPIQGNRKSLIYFWPGCPNFDNLKPSHRVRFRNWKAAEAAHYRPAHNCR